MDDLRDEFIAETRETLELLAGQLIQWERNPADRELIDGAFRFVHTVKGSCGFLDLPRLARLSHAAEEVLSHARDGKIASGADLVSATLAVIDRIAALTEALETGDSVQDDDASLIAAMLAFLPESGQLLQAVPVPLQNPENHADMDQQSKGKSRTVRVSLAMLDKLMTGVSDLVLARNEVSRQMRRNTSSSDLDVAFSRLSASVADMRDAIGQMRMQHIDRLFSSLPRLMRDICIDLGKQIELTVEGGEVEVDREMVEVLRDPLTHILRNAADHGIESTAERLANGKDAVGNIRVSARQSGNQILVEIADDGRGICLERLQKKAVARRIITAEQWSKLSDRAKLELIFSPGLSTAEQVTAISGRGVGMDVVRANMMAIGGTIDLDNEEGRGLKITLRLPMTLSIIAGLSLRAGDNMFAVSRASVVEILTGTNRNVALEQIGDVTIANVRGQRLPFSRLETILGIDAGTIEGARTLVIIKPAIGGIFALDVEAVVDHEELVVKPGAPLVMASALYAGTTLPDNGRPMLLLDASGLAAATNIDEELFNRAAQQGEHDGAEPEQIAPSGLLFVALSGRKQAIRLAAVERMEDINADDIFDVGGRLCASLHGKLIDLIDLASKPDHPKVKVLHITDGDGSKLLAVEDVIDIFPIHGAIDPAANSERYEGIVHVDGEPIELLNLYHLFEDSTGLRRGRTESAPLCFIETDAEHAHWQRCILAPLLTASGYRVSSAAEDRARADIILTGEGIAASPGDPAPVLQLRSTLQPRSTSTNSVYRYDRYGLLSAIDAQIAGVKRA